jgi:acetyl-CoA carboxylase carboxyl transferase subunit alpha
MKITAPDLEQMQCIDGIVSEPDGGAHTDPDAAAALVDEALQRHLRELRSMPCDRLLSTRYDKFRNIAQFFVES